MGMGIGMLALQCAVEFEYLWNVGLHDVRLTSFQCTKRLGSIQHVQHTELEQGLDS